MGYLRTIRRAPQCNIKKASFGETGRATYIKKYLSIKRSQIPAEKVIKCPRRAGEILEGWIMFDHKLKHKPVSLFGFLLTIMLFASWVVPFSQAEMSSATAAEADKPVPVPEKKQGKEPAPQKSLVEKKAAVEKSLKKRKAAIPAKRLFGFVLEGAPLKARAIGYYTRGCLAGGKALPVNGPAWQAMRLSRNRNWGHPKLLSFIERFAKDVRAKDGWPGVLVGDLSQPRGGPMLTGHRSHQMGLDADIWLNPMPERTLTNKEREETSAISMLDKTGLKVNPKVWTPQHVNVIKRAAGFPEVQRVLVHPAIKKALCEAAGDDRGWLRKIRPWYGHHYHMHIRLNCTEPSCKKQGGVPAGDGCEKQLDYWFALLKRPVKPNCIAGRLERKNKSWVCTCPKNLKRVALGKIGGAKCVKEDGTIPKPKVVRKNIDWMPAACRKVLVAGAAPVFKPLTLDENIELPVRKAAKLKKSAETSEADKGIADNPRE